MGSKILKLILLFTVISAPAVFAYFIKPELGAIVAALTLGLLGIFQNWVRSQFSYPELDIKFDVAPPDCHKTTMICGSEKFKALADCYYYRLKISNIGNHRAEKNEVMITDKYTENQKGEFVKDNNFLPLNFKWSHDGVIIRESIAPLLFRYCDFGHILHPKAKDYSLRGLNVEKKSRVVLELDLGVLPNTGSYLIFPGRHRVKIIAVADNSKVFSKIFEIHFNDFWDEEEEVMLKKGLRVTEVASLT